MKVASSIFTNSGSASGKKAITKHRQVDWIWISSEIIHHIEMMVSDVS